MLTTRVGSEGVAAVKPRRQRFDEVVTAESADAIAGARRWLGTALGYRVGPWRIDGDVVALIDTRTEAGTKALFGGANPAAVLYLKNEFAEKNPVTTQKLVNALMKSLKWLDTAKPEEVADLVPEEYLLGDKPLYLRAVKNSQESYSRTGIATPAAMKSMYDSLKLLDPELSNSNVDLSKTFIDSFAKKAASGS